MKPIIDLLNKIKWDKRENLEDYEVFYFDRVSRKLIGIPYKSIKRIEGRFMAVEKDDKETEIPLHRIKIVKKKGEAVWKR